MISGLDGTHILAPKVLGTNDILLPRKDSLLNALGNGNDHSTMICHRMYTTHLNENTGISLYDEGRKIIPQGKN